MLGTTTIILSAAILLGTVNTSLVLDAEIGKPLTVLHYGQKLSEEDLSSFIISGNEEQPAYPVRGQILGGQYALGAVQADGNTTLEMMVTNVEKETGWDYGDAWIITSRDKVYPLEVKHHYRAFYDCDIIESWTEIINVGRKPINIDRYYSACLPLRKSDVWVSSFNGWWSSEATLSEEPLRPGIKLFRNVEGTRNTQTSHAEMMISLDGKPCETSGRTIGAALEWGGQFDILVETDTYGNYHRFLAGICPEAAEYTLAAAEKLITPPVAFCWSDKGNGGVSRNFHDWGRRYRLQHADKPRKILLNSWEGVYLDVNEPVLKRMIRDFAAIGGELFVLDDGWFAGKYSRVKPDCALGDWTVDKKKLPNGLQPIIDEAHSLGLDFGIWLEPEMTNSISELYDKHPDWVLRTPQREPVYGRGGTQLVLDLCNPAVQDYVFSIFTNLLRNYPGIDYIKWDCNAPMLYGSQYLKRQSHLPYEYWQGFSKVCDRIRAAYPDITIQDCASGGGRVNWGVLPWFDEYWASDNTDAMQRIQIQWGTSYFFPAVGMASHIAAVPNRCNGVSTSLKYRIDVAMSGRLGMELQPSHLSEKDLEQCRRAIAEYKDIRSVVQSGDLYRLQSPFDVARGAASLMYVAKDKSEAVFFWYKTNNNIGQALSSVRMDGLEENGIYRISELDRVDIEPLPCEGRIFTGTFLMNVGIEMPVRHNLPKEEATAWSSRVLRLERVK